MKNILKRIDECFREANIAKLPYRWPASHQTKWLIIMKELGHTAVTTREVLHLVKYVPVEGTLRGAML